MGGNGEAGGIGERLEPGVAAQAHDLQAFGDVGAVEAFEGHHVAHGGERHEVEEVEQDGRGPLGAVEAAPAQLARGRHQQHEGNARGAQVAEARQVVLPVGVDDGGDSGEALIGLVVVDDDDVGAVRAGGRQRLDAGGAAVDRDDQPGALLGERRDGLAARAITLGHAVGDVDARADAVRGQKALHERGRRGAIDVVVAEHGDGLVALDRIGEPRRALVHVAHGAGVGHQRLEGGVERDGHLVEPDAARGQHPAQQLGQAVALADGDGGLGGRGIQALAPGKAARGGRDAEEGAGDGVICRNVLGNRAHSPAPQRLQAMLCQDGQGATSIRGSAPQLIARHMTRRRRGPGGPIGLGVRDPTAREPPMPLKAAIVPVTPFQQNCTLLWDEATKRGAVVDPGGDLAAHRGRHREDGDDA